MVKRSFVSVSFASSKKLQIVQLTSDKKKVKKSLSIDLPDGLIRSSKVQDEKVLATLLKGIWKKLSLKEKSVGIIVPESSTFSKLLTLPKLGATELDEAISWQAAEFLPVKRSEVILDWKLIREGKVDTQVLVVAITKDVLRGYVAAIGLAGLFPLVVETPSLSLSRFQEGEKTGVLVVYGNFGDAVLVISEGRRIFGSSVVEITDVDEIVENAMRMVRHYRDVKVAKVVIGGPIVNKDIAKRLQTNLAIPVEWIKTKIGGLEAAKIQEYLIPISLQLKDPARPVDENTVNLLPPGIVKKYDRERLKVQIWSLTLIVSLIVWTSFFTTLGTYLFFGQQIAVYESENVLKLIPPEQAKIIEQINEINGVSNDILKITSSTVAPQIIFNAISRAKPSEVSILRYRVDLESGAIEIIGTSATRQALIDLKDALEATTDFSLVQIPLSSFEKETDLQYSAKFTYLPATGKVLVPSAK